MFSTERFVHILWHHFKEVGLRIKKNVTTNQCKKGVTWEGEGLKYHGKLMTSYMEGPPRLSSISIRYKSHMLFDHNYASIWWEPKKCILQNGVKSLQKEHFYFQLPVFLQQTISKLRQRKTVARQVKNFKL